MHTLLAVKPGTIRFSTAAQALLLWLCLLQHPSQANDFAQAFTNTINPNQGTGHLIIRNSSPWLKGSLTNESVTAYSWSGTNFLAESGVFNSSALDFRRVTKAFGTYNGTNWEFATQGTNAHLVLHISRGKEEQRHMNLYGNRTVARFDFERIIARGMDPRDFATLRISSGDVYGSCQNKVPLSGKLSQTDDGDYLLDYTVQQLSISYQNRFRLEQFPTGGFVTSECEVLKIQNGATNLQDCFTLIHFGTNVLHESLSPLGLYPRAQLVMLEDDNYYAAEGNRKQLIPRASPMRPQWHQTARRGFVMLALLACTAIFWVFYSKHPDSRNHKAS